MIIVNKTISFAESIQKDAVAWIQSTYIPLLQVCPILSAVYFLKIDTQQDADECFALQVVFNNTANYIQFCEKYEVDFENILQLKFQNSIGIFKTILREV